MKTSARAALTALFFAIPLTVPASAGDDGGGAGGTPRAIVVDVGGSGGDDTVEIHGDRPHRIRINRFEGGGWMGVRLIDIPADLRVHFGAPTDAGVLVGEVEKDSPAGRAGVSVGDVVTAVDGAKVASSWEIARAVRQRTAGETVQLDVLRSRAKKTLPVKIEERPRQEVELGEMARHLGRDLSRELTTRPWRFDFDTDWNRLPGRERDGVRRLQDRVDELEKRLKELEGKRGR
jgi:membrane-associated protease RseP (regulator of RpoE activity)